MENICEYVLNETWSIFAIILKNPNLFNLHEKDIHGNSLLHLLALKNKPEFLQNLLLQGLEVNCVNNDGFTPLHLAAAADSTDIVKILINNGADVNKNDILLQSPIFQAVYNGCFTSVELLVASGAHTNLINRNGDNLLHIATRNNHKNHRQIINFLLKKFKNLDVNLRNKFGCTPLTQAIEFNNAHAAKMLIQNNADIKYLDAKNRSFLHLATIKGNIKIVKLLLKYLPTDAQDLEGITPLHISITNSCNKICTLLLNNGADVNLQDFDGYTALHLACQYGNPKVLKALLKFGAQISLVNFNGDTALHKIATCRNVENLKVLLDRGGNKYLDCRNFNNRTVLHCAAERKDVKIVAMLLEIGANAEALDSFDRSYLDYLKS